MRVHMGCCKVSCVLCVCVRADQMVDILDDLYLLCAALYSVVPWLFTCVGAWKRSGRLTTTEWRMTEHSTTTL